LSNPVFCDSGVGDAFIVFLKLIKRGGYQHVICHTFPEEHKQPIKEIFSLSPLITMEFTDDIRTDLEEITSDPHEQEIEFFPIFNNYNRFLINHPYYILQANSGKPEGYNCKKLFISSINNIIEENKDSRCILIGNNQLYKSIRNCTNLVCQTDIKDIVFLIQNCDYFIGPEGFVSFLSLSQKKNSTIFYNSYEAVKKRVVGTPWECLSNLRRMCEYQ